MKFKKLRPMKNPHLLLMLIIALGFVIFECREDRKSAAEAINPVALDLTLLPVSEASYRSDNVPVWVIFRNSGDKEIKLLKPLKPLIKQFIFLVEDEKGVSLPLPQGTFAEIEKTYEYVTLRKNEMFGIQMDLAKIDEQVKWSQGKYRVSLSYHSEFGEDCFKGELYANPITIEIKKNPTDSKPPQKDKLKN